MIVICATCDTEHRKGTDCPNQPPSYIPPKVREAMRIVYEWATRK